VLAQTVDSTLWATDGAVSSIVRDGGTIYIGGSFTWVGPATGGGVVIDASTGAPLQPYPRIADAVNSGSGGPYPGTVYAVVPDGSGGWYLGGTFKWVRGQPRNNAAHLDAKGNLTAWDPNASYAVTALAVSGGTVYAIGSFTTIGGQPRKGLAALDAISGAATAWNPNSNSIPSALAAGGGIVYVGGHQLDIGGQLRWCIAAIDATSGALTPFNPTSDGDVGALALNGGTLYAGGRFGNIGGQSRVSLAAFDVASGAVTAWNPSVDGDVSRLVVSGAMVCAVATKPGPPIAPNSGVTTVNVFDAASSATIWNTTAKVGAIAVSGGTLYVGGTFTSIGGQPRNHIAALLVGSGAVTGWNPNATGPTSSLYDLGGTVSALAANGGAVFAGGNFTSIGAQSHQWLAALDAATGIPTDWNSSPNGRVKALAVSGGTVYAIGDFTSIGGQPRNHIAALDAASGAATAWNPDLFSGGDVYALALSGSTVYVGGNFTIIGGQFRRYIAALDAVSAAPTSWNPNADGQVNALAVSGNTVYAVGSFTTIGGQPRKYIAALDAGSGTATAWNPNVTYYPPEAVAASGGTVYAKIDDAGLSALDAVSGAVTWSANVSGGIGGISALALSGGVVYVGGGFSSVGGQPRRYIAALDSASGTVTPWDPSADYPVAALAPSGGKVYAAGSFSSMLREPHSGIAAISADPTTETLLAQFQATAAADGVELRWKLGDAIRATSVAVERALHAAGPWFCIAPELHDESGITVALDRTADASVGYFYRLVVQLTSGGRAVFGPITARGRESLFRSDLTAVSPNPTSRGFQVQYAVARSGRLRIELLDVAGGIVATLADGVQPPGHYVAAWDGIGRHGRISPGVYFLRLVAPDRTAVSKVVTIR
jgi:hypothetical protein